MVSSTKSTIFTLKVNLEIKEAGTARKIATVSFDADEVSAKENQACKEISRVANIPGFRKGKAPVAVIRKRFSKELLDELNRKISTEAYQAVLAEKELRVHSILKIDTGTLNVGSPASVEVTIDIEPEFELPDYDNFELTVQPVAVNDDDIDSELQTLRDQRASFDEVERKAKTGDYVKCSYEGTIEGQPVSEILPDKPIYGKQSNTWEEAGEAKGMGVDAIAQGIIGMAKDDKKTLEAKFDEEFDIEPLAGKSVNYELEVHEVREKESTKSRRRKLFKSHEGRKCRRTQR